MKIIALCASQTLADKFAHYTIKDRQKKTFSFHLKQNSFLYKFRSRWILFALTFLKEKILNSISLFIFVACTPHPIGKRAGFLLKKYFIAEPDSVVSQATQQIQLCRYRFFFAIFFHNGLTYISV